MSITGSCCAWFWINLMIWLTSLLTHTEKFLLELSWQQAQMWKMPRWEAFLQEQNVVMANMSDCGLAVNICHADLRSEILALIYLYTPWALLTLTKMIKKGSVFQESVKRAITKGEVQFHLYISTSPCGDVRVFSLHYQYWKSHQTCSVASIFWM